MSASHYICPSCGEEIRIGPNGCPKCTRKPKQKKPPKPKPWEQDEIYDGADLDLPEDDPFDYDKFVSEEFGGPPKKLLWPLTALALIAALLYLAFRCF